MVSPDDMNSTLAVRLAATVTIGRRACSQCPSSFHIKDTRLILDMPSRRGSLAVPLLLILHVFMPGDIASHTRRDDATTVIRPTVLGGLIMRTHRLQRTVDHGGRVIEPVNRPGLKGLIDEVASLNRRCARLAGSGRIRLHGVSFPSCGASCRMRPIVMPVSMHA
jgi:hypothetical protein